MSIDRFRPYGSAPKKTSIKGNMDFDCAVFINGRKNGRWGDIPIPEAVDNFMDILMTAFNLDVDDFQTTPRDNPKILQFSIKGVDFDLVVVDNLAVGQNAGASFSVQQLQANQVFSKNHPLPDDDRVTSARLVETNVAFAAEQSSFAHEIARLAKFWNKTLILELKLNKPYVSGRSSIMETVAFEAAREEEQNCQRQKTNLGAFKRFLGMISKIDKLEIRHDKFWKEQKIPFEEAMGSIRPPYIMEPSSPKNNFLKDMESPKKLFEKFAKETLDRLDKFPRNRTELFENQPKWQNGSEESINIQEWSIGTTTTFSTHVDIKYRSDVNNMNHKKVVGFLQKYMMPNILRAAASYSNNNNNNKNNKNYKNNNSNNNNKMSYVQEAVERTISHDIEGRDIQWVTTHEQTRDVCLTVPLNDVERNAVRISFNF